jgi:hypothetical protein
LAIQKGKSNTGVLKRVLSLLGAIIRLTLAIGAAVLAFIGLRQKVKELSSGSDKENIQRNRQREEKP